MWDDLQDPGPTGPAPIEGVLFDLHSTLVDQGDPLHWLTLAWRRAGRPGPIGNGWPPGRTAEVTGWLAVIWEHAREVDPHNDRDRSPQLHRAVFDRIVATVPEIDDRLAHALYATVLDTWTPYRDTLPTLADLRRRGVRTAVLSNIGIDARPMLERAGMLDLVDAVVLSYEIGKVKPGPEIFAHALELIGVRPERALMVGDSWRDDAGASQLGVRSLILPRTPGPEHGLEAVLRLIGRP